MISGEVVGKVRRWRLIGGYRLVGDSSALVRRVLVHVDVYICGEMLLRGHASNEVSVVDMQLRGDYGLYRVAWGLLAGGSMW